MSRRRRSTQVMPVNVSALQPNYTAPNYINDTVEVFRTCPEYVDQKGGQEITVIGRNFFDTDLLQCKFTACRSNSSVATHREEPQICAVPNQHTDSEGTPSATRCGDTMVRDCVEINPCVGAHAAVLARSSNEEPASPRHRADIMKMARRSTRRFCTNAP